MDFQIKLFRWPRSESDVVLIGRGQAVLEAAANLEEPDESLCKALENYFRQVTPVELPQSTLLAKVRRTITESLKDGKPELTRVAGVLGLGPRTLQRRLSKCGVDFKELADEIRCELAVNYLKDCNHKLTDIALLLGYSEVSAFNRAFKRWTDSTPLSYRRMFGRFSRRK